MHVRVVGSASSGEQRGGPRQREREKGRGEREGGGSSGKRRIYAFEFVGPARNAARIYTHVGPALSASFEFELLRVRWAARSLIGRMVVVVVGGGGGEAVSFGVGWPQISLSDSGAQTQAHRIRLIAAGIVDTAQDAGKRERDRETPEFDFIEKLGIANYTLVRTQSNGDELGSE